MKKVLVCARGPHNGSYVGGLISILKAYFNHTDIFENNGFKLESFDYQPSEEWEHKNQKVANIAYIFQQRAALKKRLAKDDNVILNIHTSKEFLFLKDVALARMAKRKYHIPVAITIHVGDIETVFNRIDLYRKLLIKWLNKYVDKTIFLSKEIKGQFVNAGLNSDGAEVLYNFHDLAKTEKGLQRRKKLHLLYVGAIHREKGIMELITALDELASEDCYLDICGMITDPSIKESFETLVKKLSSQVELHGYVSGEDKTMLYNRADVLILPSYHEGMPLVVLEALSGKCAIISTRVGATPEIMEDKNVLWVNTRDVKSLKEAIRLLLVSPQRVEEMKKNNYELSENFTIKENIDGLCKILRKAL